jgi:LPXTG-motif cell wall-anchored protein
MIKDADKPTFVEASAGSSDDSGSAFNLVNILIALVILVVIAFIVAKRRKKDSDTK